MARATGTQARNRRTTKRQFFRKQPVEAVALYANTLLRQIKRHLGHAVSFTREDLLSLPVPAFSQVATITRYRATCVAVAYLIEEGHLIPKKFPDLCLPENEDKYQFEETSVSVEYEPTIRRLVRTMPAEAPFAVMHVVGIWRTDPQLTSDTKRKAVRQTIPRLLRDGVCKRVAGSAFEYIIEKPVATEVEQQA